MSASRPPGASGTTPGRSPGFHVHQERAEEAVLHVDGMPSGTGRVVFCGNHVLRIEFDAPAPSPPALTRGGRPGRPTAEGGVWGSFVDYIRELEERVADYEESINWDTPCMACAKRLTKEYGELMASDPTPTRPSDAYQVKQPEDRFCSAADPVTLKELDRISARDQRWNEGGQNPGEQASGNQVDPADHAEGGGSEADGGDHEQHDHENVHAEVVPRKTILRHPFEPIPGWVPRDSRLRWCLNCNRRIVRLRTTDLVPEAFWSHFNGSRLCVNGLTARP